MELRAAFTGVTNNFNILILHYSRATFVWKMAETNKSDSTRPGVICCSSPYRFSSNLKKSAAAAAVAVALPITWCCTLWRCRRFFCPILGTLFRSVRHRMHTNGRLSGVWKTQHQQNKKNNGSAHNPNPRIYLVWKLGWTMAEWEHFRDTKKWAEENFVCRQTERNCALLMAKHGVSLWRRLRTENTQRHTKAKKGKHFVPFTFYTNELLFKLRVKLFHLIRFSNENMLFHFV